MWERIGRVAKDKVSGAKGWVDKGANLDADINVRGATSGAVIGVIQRLYISIIFRTAALSKNPFPPYTVALPKFEYEHCK